MTLATIPENRFAYLLTTQKEVGPITKKVKLVIKTVHHAMESSVQVASVSCQRLIEACVQNIAGGKHN